MSLPSDLPQWTKKLVAHYGIRAGQRLGQHFLIDSSVLVSALAAAQLNSSSKVLEVGGGLGVLTMALLEQAGRVVTVELDARLAEGLRKLSFDEKLKVLEGDILKISDREICAALGIGQNEPFSIVANLPYEISGVFLRRFLSGPLKPEQMVLLLQREVAERLSAKPGQTSLISLSAQLYAHVEIVRLVHPRSFWPAPKVESALVRLQLKSTEELSAVLPSPAFEKRFWQVARVGFASRRKLLTNNLASVFSNKHGDLSELLTKAGLKPTARAQELSVEQWLSLVNVLEQ